MTYSTNKSKQFIDESIMNMAINKSFSDSLYVKMADECKIPMSIKYQIENRYLFSFSDLYFTNNILFKKYLNNYIDKDSTSLVNYNYLSNFDSIREVNFKKIIFDTVNNKCDNFIYFDIVNDTILQLNIESINCPWRGIELIYIFNNDTLIEFGKWQYNY